MEILTQSYINLFSDKKQQKTANEQKENWELIKDLENFPIEVSIIILY